MKKAIKLFSLVAVLGMFMISCTPSELKGYKKTDGGLYYKFEVENKEAVPTKTGDIMIAEVEIRFKDSTLFSNVGNPERMFKVSEKSLFLGDLNEGLLMMHIGDKAIFAVSADSMAAAFPLPETFEKGKGEKLFIHITLQSIVSEDEYAKEMTLYIENLKNAEKDSIASYITKNNIKVRPTAEGLYIVSIKKGNGAKVEAGKKVKMNYIGKFLDGRVFDTSIEIAAKEGGIHNPQRPYEPLEYVVGQTPLIQGWDLTALTMRAGDIVEVIIPSNLAYGENGQQGAIPPYSPLVFRMELVSVE